MKYLSLLFFLLLLFPAQQVLAGSLLQTDPLMSPISDATETVGQNIGPNQTIINSFSGLIMDIPLLAQEKNLSCEAASVKMILSYFGQDISEAAIQDSFSQNPDPNLGFRGNVNGAVWGFADYGVYPQVVVSTFKKYGLTATASQNITESEVKQAVLSGHPVIIWVDIADPRPQERDVQINNNAVKLISGEHTVVVTGFKDGKWYLNDPWRRTYKGQYRLPEKEVVASLDDTKWGLLNHMAVIVN